MKGKSQGKNIVNSSLSKASFPSEMKRALIKPTIKKDKR